MRAYWTLAGVLALCMSPVSVRADEPAHAEAKRRMAEGKALAEQGKFDEARLRYAEACTVLRTFNCLVGLASTEYRSAHFVEAFDHLTEAIRDPKAGSLGPDLRQQLNTMRQGAQRATAHILVNAQPGASVLLDGRVVGAAPLAEALTTMPGKHLVEAQTPAGTQRVEVDAIAGDPTRADLLFVPPPAPVTPSVVPAPIPPPPSSPAPEQATTSWWTTSRTVGAGVGVVGLIGIASGVGFRLASNGNANQVSTLRASIPPGSCALATPSAACTNVQNKINAANQDATLSTVSFVVGGVAVAGSLALIVFGGGEPAKTRTGSVEWTPVVGLGSVGVAGDF